MISSRLHFQKKRTEKKIFEAGDEEVREASRSGGNYIREIRPVGSVAYMLTIREGVLHIAT